MQIYFVNYDFTNLPQPIQTLRCNMHSVNFRKSRQIKEDMEAWNNQYIMGVHK